jgi:uncharacterized membrane protein
MSPSRLRREVSRYDWLLVLHLFGAAALFGGAVAYHTVHLALLRTDRPRRIATLFGLGRPFELAIQVGALATLVFGIWLAYTDHEVPRYGLGQGWIIAAIVLWVVANGLGAVGGKTYQKAKERAEELAAVSDEPSAELRAMIRDPRAAVMTWTSTAMIVTILVLMVWKPGA